MKEAMLYQKLENKMVQCHLCSHLCKLMPGKSGNCRVRKNIDGTLYSLIHGRIIAHHCDPIEKKPLYHYLPGSKTLSIGTIGCNFHCLFCQNCEISQIKNEQITEYGVPFSPEEVVGLAIQKGCKSIAYTYNEPTIFFEYAYDIAKLAHQNDLKNIWVSNGFMTQEMLDWMLPLLDAVNIDLKSFKDDTYRNLTGGHLVPVLNSIKKIVKSGTWLEITTLIIPGVNDNSHELNEIAQYIAKQLGPDVPWHISRFFPAYKMKHLSPTPTETLYMAHDIGKNAGLKYVYVGNIPTNEYQNTYCPQCNSLLIARMGYHIYPYNVNNGYCPHCGTPIPIIT